MRIGYCRVSTQDQNTDAQRQQLEAAGAERIYEEKASGKSADDRSALQAALAFIREGDVLLISKLDRLARSLPDLFKIIETLERKGAQLIVLNNSAIDTTTPMGRCVFAIFGAIAELERNLIRERQTEGIRAAKTRGAYRGGKRRFDPAEIRRLHAGGKRPHEIKTALGCSFDTITRALKANGEAHA